MATWYPGALSYREWVQAESYKEEISNVIKEHANEIVANQQQTRIAISRRLDRVATISDSGFKNVTNAIEGLHSMLSYKLGLILQELEIQSGLLQEILHTLKNPLKTQVEEYYNDGCRLVREAILDKAIQKFTKIIEDLDDTHYLTYYQLGLLFLNGKSEDENVIDLQRANTLLITACRLGKGKAKTDKSFNPAVANALFFTSLSYYLQIESESDTLLDRAIAYAEESIIYNPKLSQSCYHLAKYYSIKDDVEKMKLRLREAIELDRNYALDVNEDKAFDKNRIQVDELLKYLRDKKRIISEGCLKNVKSISASLQAYNLTETVYEYEVKNWVRRLDLATMNHNYNTYFGYLDAIQMFETLESDGKKLLIDIQIHFSTLRSEKKKSILNTIGGGIVGPIIGGIGGLCLGLIIGIPGCFVVAYNKDSASAGERFLDNTSTICILAGVVIGLIAGISLGPTGYRNYIASKRRK